MTLSPHFLKREVEAVMKEKVKKAFRTIRLTFVNFSYHSGGKNAAALAYYLLFALFPLLIFLSNFLGLLELDIYSITATLTEFLPREIVDIIENYLDYTAQNSSHTLMWFAFVFSVWFPMRAVRGLMTDVRRIYGLGRPHYPVVQTVIQLLYTVVFVAVISITLVLSMMGENVITFVCGFFPKEILDISEYLLRAWQYLRFLPMGILMFVAIATLYFLAIDGKRPVRKVLPGIFLSMVSWMVLSIGFSVYVENFANYSIIYGAMGAVMILLIWLYLSANILLLGAEFNVALEESKKI